MSEKTEIVVTRTIDAPAEDLFDVLTLPARHKEFDGSGMVVADDRTQRLLAVGDKFTMNMHHESQGGDYQMENHVIAYAHNKLIGWAPARPGEEPAGWKWVYMLEARGSGATDVTLTYDWTNVTDKELIPLFPAVPEKALEESLNLLAAAVA
ncbi:SRPBCC family protein [Granulicoccus sp. GXG6511]|uniref:SRPBCC family protein n=1 Tax=Granulicoccus sp. GXG6511 TaxID=3381351 RepID=UPI003D7F0091